MYSYKLFSFVQFSVVMTVHVNHSITIVVASHNRMCTTIVLAFSVCVV